jgi:hypothetical protein
MADQDPNKIVRYRYIIFNADDTFTLSSDIPTEDKEYKIIEYPLLDLYEDSEPQFVMFTYNKDTKQLEEIEDADSIDDHLRVEETEDGMA